MKYIRTKDGIFELVILDKEHQYLKRNVLIAPLIEKIDIVKKADTIEELCDEFVMFSKNRKKPASV